MTARISGVLYWLSVVWVVLAYAVWSITVWWQPGPRSCSVWEPFILLGFTWYAIVLFGISALLRPHLARSLAFLGLLALNPVLFFACGQIFGYVALNG